MAALYSSEGLDAEVPQFVHRSRKIFSMFQKPRAPKNPGQPARFPVLPGRGLRLPTRHRQGAFLPPVSGPRSVQQTPGLSPTGRRRKRGKPGGPHPIPALSIPPPEAQAWPPGGPAGRPMANAPASRGTRATPPRCLPAVPAAPRRRCRARAAGGTGRPPLRARPPTAGPRLPTLPEVPPRLPGRASRRAGRIPATLASRLPYRPRLLPLAHRHTSASPCR
jgi:hypothetical protein